MTIILKWVRPFPIKTEGRGWKLIFSWKSFVNYFYIFNKGVRKKMNFNHILLQTYESDIEELELERADLTYYPGFDGEIVEKFV